MNEIPRDLLPKFYVTAPAPCPYLPEFEERKIFTYLERGETDKLHDLLSRAGFRRSQRIVYKPVCEGCMACVSVRVRNADFRLSRSWRRIARRNSDVVAHEEPLVATFEQYRMLRAYILSRHGEGGMTDMSYGDYRRMVEDSPVETQLISYRLAESGLLVGLCLLDMLSDGPSLVYSGFEPDEASRSLGSWMILDRILDAREKGLPYTYLGYWIDSCAKMSYKTRFRPLEALNRDGWIEV